MKIEKIRIQNFRSLHNIELDNIPSLAVFVGENGSGKSTIFQVFAFLKDALKNNINTALQKLGGYDEVATRGHTAEPILIEIQFRMQIVNYSRLVTYHLEIVKDSEDKIVIKREILKYKRGSHGSPYHFLDFSYGKGFAISNEEDFSKPDTELTKEEQNLSSSDILAIKGLGQFLKFKAASAFRNLIENWHVSDFHIMAARQIVDIGFAEHLSESGANLALVTQYLSKSKPDIFKKIIEKFQMSIPGMDAVEAEVTPDGRVLLKFKDGSVKEPFIARYVSDGTIKMFAYLVLLYDPKPHPFLCIEEPENQLYPHLFYNLVDELRQYAQKGGQVFVSSHSPDLLHHVKIEEAFFLKKEKCKTKVYPIQKNENIKSLIEAGDKLGWLWTQGALSDNK